jgi:hypothetical protein
MKMLGDFGSEEMTEYEEVTNLDSGMGWPKIKIKKPKISIKAPKVTIKPLKVKLPTTAKGLLRDIGKVSGEGLKIMNPLNQVKMIMTNVPLLKDVYRETDKFTGGTITKLTNVSNLASKALKGKPISKGELIEAAMVAAQIGAIVASGGSASAFIGAGAGALKNGPLGKTSLGRDLLTFAEIAGNAAALSKAAGSQMAQQAGKKAAQEAGRSIAVEAATKAVKDKAISIARTKAEDEFQKKTGSPVGMLSKLYNVTSGKSFSAQTPKDILKVVAEDKLKKLGLGDSATQAILSNNAAQLGVAIRNAPSLAMDKAKRELQAQKIKAQSALSLEGMKKKIEKKVDKSLKDATNIQGIMAQMDKTIDAKAKEILRKQLAEQLDRLSTQQSSLVRDAEEYQLQASRDSVKVAAAEEGRLVDNNKIIAGVAGMAIISVGMLYFFQRGR